MCASGSRLSRSATASVHCADVVAEPLRSDRAPATHQRTRGVACAQEVVAMTLSELLARYDITEADLSTRRWNVVCRRSPTRVADLTLGRGGVLDATRRQHRSATGQGSPLDRATDATMSVIGAASRSLTIEQAAEPPRRPPLPGVTPPARPPALLVPHRFAATAAAVAVHAPRGAPAGTGDGARRAARRPAPGRGRGLLHDARPDLDDATPASGWRPAGDPQRVLDEAEGLELR